MFSAGLSLHLTCMSDAAQVVQDIVERLVGLLTCLGNQRSGLNVYHDTLQLNYKRYLNVLIILVALFPALFYYHYENG